MVKMIFQGGILTSQSKAAGFKQLGRNDSSQLNKIASKGNSLCAQGKIMMLWLMIIHLIGKLIVKGEKLLIQNWFAL